jgi:cation diffusion facilitator CzcD-associated flavoprotein CzcO
MTNKIDIAIVGGGPHALTLATHLLQKRSRMRNKFLVFDPNSRWMYQWQQQFAALEIPHLRSPAVHHPDPDPFALRRFAESRPNEFFPPYDLPGTQLFWDFCNDLIKRWQLEDKFVRTGITSIGVIDQKKENTETKGSLPQETRRYKFCLQHSNGEETIARRVVLATGGGTASLPNWVQQIQPNYPPDRLLHSHDIDLRSRSVSERESLKLAGEKVLIIGGGLTSGHLAVGAMNKGAKVMLMYRRRLQEKLFDADPGWLGPKYLKGFFNQDWLTRSRLIQSARDGGSITPEIMLKLNRSKREGKLEVYEECQIVKASWQGSRWQVVCDNGAEYQCDRIWLGTGTRLDAFSHPLLQQILTNFPTEMIQGLPILDAHLRIPGLPLFLMGSLAALQVGPVARNLSGARMASQKIVDGLIQS